MRKIYLERTSGLSSELKKKTRTLHPLNFCLRCLSVLTLLACFFSPHNAFAQDAEQVLSQPIQKLSPIQELSDEQVKRAFAQKKPTEAPITPSASKSVSEFVTRPDDDLLILSLNLGKVTLTDTLLTYEDLETGKYFIPLQDFVQALEFPIDVNLDQGTAQGWFLNESRKFALDLSAGTAVISGKEQTLSPEDIEHHHDGIYISLEQLQKWFPITLEVNFTQLAIIIKSLEPLPVELRLAREERRGKLANPDGKEKKQYPLQNVNAPLFTFPFMNVNTQSTYDNKDTVEKSLSHSGTLLATGIVLGQDAELSVNGGTIGNQRIDVRGSIGLKDPENDLFGIGLSEYKLGDVNTRPIPFLARGGAGRGLSFSSKNLDSGGAQSGEIQLRGELPTGYQVDVMRNGQLLEFLEEPDENGEYVFDLDVFPGLNVFELVFYGPEGQKEVKEERIFIPPNGIEKGAFDITTEMIQDDTNLFTDRNSNGENAGEYRLTTTAEYGLTETSSLFAAFTDLSFEGDRQRYGLLRYNQSIGGMRADTTLARSSEGGNAFSIRTQSIFRGLRWQLQHDYFDDFQSEETESLGLSGQIEHATNFRLSGLLPLIKNTPFTLNLDRLSNEEDIEQIAWQARVTKNIKKIRFTTEIDQRIQDELDRETNLNLQIGSRYDNVNLRGAVTYELEPELLLSNVSLNADWNINKKTALRAAVQRSGSEDPVHTLTLGGSREFNAIRLGLNTSYNDDNDFRALLTSSFSIGYDPYKNRPFVQSKRLADSALFAPRVYYDENNNNLFDGQDEWLKGISFKGGHADRGKSTNDQGTVLLSGVPPYEREKIALENSTLPDAYFRSKIPPRDYILRSSQVLKAEYPVILVGEVDGQTYNIKYGEKRDAQSIKIQIISPETQEIVVSGASEYDGFLLMQDIPMGQYILRTDPQQIENLGYCQPKPQAISLSADEPFAAIQDITLWPKTNKGSVNIVLGCHDSVENMTEAWETLKPDLKEILRKFHDNSDTKYVYGIELKPGHHDLVLHDIPAEKSENICEELKQKGISCKPVKSEGFCPQNVKELSRIDYRTTDNPE